MAEDLSPTSTIAVSQINARSYSGGGVSSTSNIFHDVGYVSNSVNIEVNAGVYNEAHQASPSTKGLKALFRNIGDAAIHNSSERGDAPKCHEGTRVAVLNEISDWISGDSGEASKRFLWVNGPAGWGKTAMMGSLADKWHDEGNLAASFFFSASSVSSHTRSKRRFITTLVYQIQQHQGLDQYIGQKIAAAVIKDPAILGKHLKEQVEVLLLKPLRDCRAYCDMSAVPKVVVIDGLDECEADQDQDQRTNQRDQEEILACLLQASGDPAFPFKIIISSRPERSIRNFLLNEHHANPNNISQLSLGGKQGPKIGAEQGPRGGALEWDPDKDIERFLRSKFREIRREYPHLRTLGHWPGERYITKLVRTASGQFAYAEAAIRFIKTPSNPPQIQLEYILGLRRDPGVSPLDRLDALYIKILNSTPKPALTFQWLLAYRWFQRKTEDRTHSMTEGVTAWFFARLCETTAGEADIVFGDLAALVQVPDHSDLDSKYTFHHRSFLDFLDDPSRGRAVHSQTQNETRRWIIARFMRSLKCKGPEVPIANPNHLPKFTLHFFKLWARIVAEKEASSLLIQQRELSQCDAAWWVNHDSVVYNPTASKGFWRVMCALVHGECRIYSPCVPACKRWRDAVVRAGKVDNPRLNAASNNDRFFVKLKRLSNMSNMSPLSPRSPGPP